MAHHSPTSQHTKATTCLTCPSCEAPLTNANLADLGLRVPDPGETPEAYCDAELLDPRELRHLRCSERAPDLTP